MCYTYDMKTTHDKQRFVEQLLAWYDTHKRILPWRDHPTPYAVWVSEIMLQQTRVEAVKPYYERFIQALPDMHTLAACEDDSLAKLWEGLGYYNRVRNMKKCACICEEQYDGALPADYDKLLALPGIGAYTAGAIASIAYRIPVCAVDGNVLRLFSRVLCREDDITKEATKKRFQAIISEYIPRRCDAFNQALMEIGALICIPNGAPLCHKCPIASECMAYQTGRQGQLPIKHPKKARMIEKHSVLLILHNGCVHIQKRPKQGLLAGLYEFDFIDGTLNEAQAKDYAKSYGIIDSIHPLPQAKHIFTHKEWHMSGWLILLQERNNNQKDDGIWINQKELLESYALPHAFKVYRELCLAIMKGAIQNESMLI